MGRASKVQAVYLCGPRDQGVGTQAAERPTRMAALLPLNGGAGVGAAVGGAVVGRAGRERQ